MKKINSYIFLEREEKIFQKKENGDEVLDLGNIMNVISVLKNIFSAKDNDFSFKKLRNSVDETKEFEEMMLQKTIGSFSLNIDKIKQIINFNFCSVNSTEYLDIIIENDNEDIIIKFMKEIDKIIISNSILNENYIIVTSYDSISEYYCNKVFPKLNEFERKFRKLLYMTYTAQFQKSYFEVTTSKELQEKAKENIRKKKNDYRIQQYLYSLDFYAFKQLLFEKSWNEYDEKQLNKYLKKHRDLTKLSDSEIRNKILSIHPKNDWERLFNNKELDEDFENIITRIGQLRNIVAHNKLIKEEEYNELNKLLDNSIITIDKAIIITETEDFKRINNDKINEILENLSKMFSEKFKEINEFFMNTKKILEILKK